MHEPLLAWYAANARDLPWRRTRDPYAILVSEVMLQQTQVARVVPRYLAWLERWPTVEALAAATPADVITAWSRLGLQPPGRQPAPLRAGRGGRGGFPREPAELQRLPGVGPYTAAAIACFAFGAQIAAPDTNAKRVLERAFGRPTCSPRRAGRTSGTRRSSTSAARCASPARRAASVCPLASGVPVARADVRTAAAPVALRGLVPAAAGRLLRAIAAAGSLPDAEADAEALVSLVRDGLAEVSDGQARLPGQTSLATSAARPSSEGSSASGA